MSQEGRIKKLEQSVRNENIRFETIEEDDPEREEKIRQAEQEARAAGERLVVWDIVDGSL